MDRRYHLKSQLELLGGEPKAIEDYLTFVLTCEAVAKDPSNHKHHVLPKCLFPGFQSFKKNPWNQSFLSPTDHIEAHRLLAEVFPGNSNLALVHALMSKWKGSARLKGSIRIHNETRHRLIYWGELPAYLERGWQLGTRKGRCWHNDGKTEFLVHPDQSQNLKEGRLIPNPSTAGHIRITNGSHTLCVLPEEAEIYLVQGYTRGMAPVDRSWVKGTRVYNNGLIEIKVRDFSIEKYPGFKLGSLPEHIQNQTRQNYAWYTNGKKNIHLPNGSPIPEGFTKGRKFTKPRAKNAKSKRWYTNGLDQRQIFEGDAIPEGYSPGRLQGRPRRSRQ